MAWAWASHQKVPDQRRRHIRSGDIADRAAAGSLDGNVVLAEVGPELGVRSITKCIWISLWVEVRLHGGIFIRNIGATASIGPGSFCYRAV